MWLDAFLNVGAAGTAAVFTVTFIHPIDLVKTRLQISGDAASGGINYKAMGVRGTVTHVLTNEGVKSFWKGIGAAWLREASYTSLRLGLYDPIKKVLGVNKDSNFLFKFGAGSLAGAIGSLAGNPFDVLKTRMMATAGKETPKLMATAAEVYRNNGFWGFYRGIDANIMRAMVLNGTKMGVYDQIKTMIKKTGLFPAGIITQFTAAFTAGFFMSCTVSPFDMIRTRLMNQPPGVKLYTGFLDCGVKLIRANGVLGLYAGFMPIWARFAPTTCLQLVIFEQLKPVFGVSGSGGGD